MDATSSSSNASAQPNQAPPTAADSSSRTSQTPQFLLHTTHGSTNNPLSMGGGGDGGDEAAGGRSGGGRKQAYNPLGDEDPQRKRSASDAFQDLGPPLTSEGNARRVRSGGSISRRDFGDRSDLGPSASADLWYRDQSQLHTGAGDSLPMYGHPLQQYSTLRVSPGTTTFRASGHAAPEHDTFHRMDLRALSQPNYPPQQRQSFPSMYSTYSAAGESSSNLLYGTDYGAAQQRQAAVLPSYRDMQRGAEALRPDPLAGLAKQPTISDITHTSTTWTRPESSTSVLPPGEIPDLDAVRRVKGLRHFSKCVADKVKKKGATTYNEVADELVEEFTTQARNADAFDHKNIRRRVYDALNVLMAMGVIVKDRKDIRWTGVPTKTSFEDDIEALKTRNAELTAQTELERKALAETTRKHRLFKALVQRNSKLPPQPPQPTPSQPTNISTPSSPIIRLPFLLVCSNKAATVEHEITQKNKSCVVRVNGPSLLLEDVDIIARVLSAGSVGGTTPKMATGERREAVSLQVPGGSRGEYTRASIQFPKPAEAVESGDGGNI
ncbi:E2F/DP family winged-helix DNA-binding domain-containing protein [Fimicolochytrium jonesii]|uniref:E2F/DP family winged-helix DNA-binding domain-containing protein n=1 Tax=Fimicolochytrium jonesii TaxID=1396493 RepID=UPI0022FEC54D|nr:E2F/DP family winged-helix DNA-binding domain-containing protein [Fimicolochytrium jonesii]KAI8821113.1 E2F/DP family winged-helix DNA-binding domain-containing protein [Fimicolochytrium jonesii]